MMTHEGETKGSQKTCFPSETKGGPQKKQPGLQHDMPLQPESIKLSETIGQEVPTLEDYVGVNKLKGCRALITGGDSGIGRSVACLYAKEGIEHISIVYLPTEQKDAEITCQLIKQCSSHQRTQCHLITADLSVPSECERVVSEAISRMNGLNILVNNASRQEVCEDFSQISPKQIEQTFQTNILNYLYVTRAALPYLPRGSKIINSASVTAFKGKSELVDYASTKGAIIAFTRSLALQLASKGIRVNAVAPGPIWTPLIPASFNQEQIEEFGKNVPLGRMGQPIEAATSYVFLAGAESSYFTGQTLHPNGGSIVGS